MKAKKQIWKKTMTGLELQEKLPYIRRRGEDIHEQPSMAYQRLAQLSASYQTAIFKFCKKQPNKKMSIFEIYGGLQVYCKYGEPMRFYIVLPKQFLWWQRAGPLGLALCHAYNLLYYFSLILQIINKKIRTPLVKTWIL